MSISTPDPSPCCSPQLWFKDPVGCNLPSPSCSIPAAWQLEQVQPLGPIKPRVRLSKKQRSRGPKGTSRCRLGREPLTWTLGYRPQPRAPIQRALGWHNLPTMPWERH